jgi:hypothetical protein
VGVTTTHANRANESWSMIPKSEYRFSEEIVLHWSGMTTRRKVIRPQRIPASSLIPRRADCRSAASSELIGDVIHGGKNRLNGITGDKRESRSGQPEIRDDSAEADGHAGERSYEDTDRMPDG